MIPTLGYFSAQASSGELRAVLRALESLAIDAASKGAERTGEAYARACLAVLDAERESERNRAWIRSHCTPYP